MSRVFSFLRPSLPFPPSFARRLHSDPVGRFGHTLHEYSPGFWSLTLSRPDVHNAFSDRMIAALTETLDMVAASPSARGLFLRGEGRSFCAGADLEWMRRAASFSLDESRADAFALSKMLHKLASLPCATVALVQGNAFGGGIGLIAACDIAVSVRQAGFALSEARLGIIPATISPYVLRRIGSAQAHRYFLTAERFNAERAQRIGLVHELADDVEGLERWATHFESSLRACAPTSVRGGKMLIEAVEGKSISDTLLTETAHMLSVQRSSEEGREGLSAFLEKRPAAWFVEKR